MMARLRVYHDKTPIMRVHPRTLGSSGPTADMEGCEGVFLRKR